MNKLINEQEQVRYVIKVNGQTVSVPFATRPLAEAHLGNLPQDQQIIAEIVPVTEDNKQILFG